MVLLFSISYLSSTNGEDDIHAISGYGMAVLLCLRFVWGFVGADYARFSRFRFSISHIFIHAQQMMCNKPPYYLGHSPVGSVMVFFLLGLLSCIVGLGLMSQAWTEFTGPLWHLGLIPSDTWGRVAENGHEFLAQASVIFIVLHIAGVALACVQHRENLVAAMIHGYKKDC